MANHQQKEIVTFHHQENGNGQSRLTFKYFPKLIDKLSFFLAAIVFVKYIENNVHKLSFLLYIEK